MRLPGARSAYDLNAELADRLAAARRARWARGDRAALLAEVRRITGIRALAALPVPSVDSAGAVVRDGYRIEKLIFRPEPDLWIPALRCVPLVPSVLRKPACLYVSAAGKQADAAPGGPIEQLVRQGQVVLAVDLPGIGETQPDPKRNANKYLGGNWLELYRPYLLGTSYVARWAEDILVCARWLAQQPGAAAGRVRLVSVGRTGPAALHAAALEPQLFAGGTLRQSLASWDMVARTPLATNQLINCVHGALVAYDLSDLAGTLPRGAFEIVEPLDAREQPVATAPGH